MKTNQLTQGQARRVMYVENKNGLIDGVIARIGWVEFSKSGRSVYFHGKSLKLAKGGGVAGNFFDEETSEEYWVSGIKRRGSNAHPAEYAISIVIDDDARDEYERLRSL